MGESKALFDLARVDVALRVPLLRGFFADHLQDDFHIALLLAETKSYQKAWIAEVEKKK